MAALRDGFQDQRVTQVLKEPPEEGAGELKVERTGSGLWTGGSLGVFGGFFLVEPAGLREALMGLGLYLYLE